MEYYEYYTNISYILYEYIMEYYEYGISRIRCHSGPMHLLMSNTLDGRFQRVFTYIYVPMGNIECSGKRSNSNSLLADIQHNSSADKIFVRRGVRLMLTCEDCHLYLEVVIALYDTKMYVICLKSKM